MAPFPTMHSGYQADHDASSGDAHSLHKPSAEYKDAYQDWIAPSMPLDGGSGSSPSHKVLGAGLVAKLGSGVMVELEGLFGGFQRGGQHYVGYPVFGRP